MLPLTVYLRVALDGLGVDIYEERFLGQPQLTFRFPYVGLPGLDAFAFLEGENLLAVALTALMRCPSERKPELKATSLQRVATASVNPARRYLLAECIQAYLDMEAPQLQEYEYLLRTGPYQEARTMAQTAFVQAVEAAEKRGRIETLLRQLQSKFGPLTEAQRDRLNEMTVERLNTLAEAVLTATNLRDLGLED